MWVLGGAVIAYSVLLIGTLKAQGARIAVAAVAAVLIAGFATMWMAIAADVGASLLVIANGMRMIERD